MDPMIQDLLWLLQNQKKIFFLGLELRLPQYAIPLATP